MRVSSTFTSVSQKPDTIAGYSVRCAPDTPVLPGCGDTKRLTLQGIVRKKVAEEYGYLYPYVPETLIQSNVNQAQWIDTAFRGFLKIPAVCDVKKLSPRNAKRDTLLSCKPGIMVDTFTLTVLLADGLIKLTYGVISPLSDRQGSQFNCWIQVTTGDVTMHFVLESAWNTALLNCLAVLFYRK